MNIVILIDDLIVTLLIHLFTNYSIAYKLILEIMTNTNQTDTINND